MAVDHRAPFSSADEAWAALEEQRGMSDGDLIDLWQHQVQTADALLHQGADDELVVAGLLHDLGDGRVSEVAHGPWAARLVQPLLGARVAWLVGAHADAKRYLCTVDPAYRATLSPLSRHTLLRQGGLMSAGEVAAFAAHPWADDALRLRRCDDAGKDQHRQVADVQRFRVLLDCVAAAHASRRDAPSPDAGPRS